MQTEGLENDGRGSSIAQTQMDGDKWLWATYNPLAKVLRNWIDICNEMCIGYCKGATGVKTDNILMFTNDETS